MTPRPTNTKQEQQRTLHFEVPIEALRNFAATCPMPGDSTQRRQGNEIARGFRTPDGPGTLFLRCEPSSLEARAWGPGSEWLLFHLPAMVGLADETFEDFQPEEEPLVSLLRRRQGMRLAKSLRPFDTLVAVVLQQKVVGKEASWSYRRLLRSVSDKAPGPIDLFLPPTPEQLLALDYAEFHPFGIERKRATTLLTVARFARKIDATSSASDETGAARTLLPKIPGIGEWSVAKVLQAAFGDPDAVHVGDYHLANYVGYNLAGEARATDQRMLELLAPFAGHRHRAIRLIETMGSKPPRYGPRLAFRRVERF